MRTCRQEKGLGWPRNAKLAGPVMPRPIWKGAITFGMISIPVKLFGATESKDVAFNTLHKECKSRLKQ
jgi:non-homologous end joining protein Ku